MFKELQNIFQLPDASTSEAEYSNIWNQIMKRKATAFAHMFSNWTTSKKRLNIFKSKRFYQIINLHPFKAKKE